MSKPSISLRVPKNHLDEIEEIQEREGIEDRSEATRQVLRRGIENAKGQSAGEQLGQQATAVAGVGTLVAGIGALLGDPTTAGLLIQFAAATFLFAMLWASIRVLDGRELV